jgi:hypothetical protein
MPNWVYNTLTIEGDVSPVQMFKAKVETPYEFVSHEYNPETKQRETKIEMSERAFSFWNIIQPPKERLGLYFGVADGSEDKTWNWYNWNNNNWGTKWDACSPTLVEDSNNKVVYRFDTAWSPADPVVMKASEDYPDLTIRLDYEEEQGWGGYYVLKAGKVLQQESWDIPNSHAEVIKRGNECWCDGYEEDDDKPFSDCPKSEVS